MTKMEACHHLTQLRDLIVSERDRHRSRLKNNVDQKDDSDRQYIEKRIDQCDAEIRAIEMAGSALTK
jgi:hypothetical protein